MMKVRFQIAFLAVLLTCFVGLTGQVQAQTKVGFTNVELLLAVMPETQNIEKQLKIYETKLTEKLQTQQQDYQKKLEEYMTKKQANAVSPAQEETYVKELTAMEQNIQKGAQEAEYKLLVKREELLKPLTEKVQVAINEVAKEGGYTYILNQTMGGGITNILFGVEQYDITDELATKLKIPLPQEGDNK